MAWASRSTTKWSARPSSTGLAASTRRYGTHETLLAYLVRRLLENGANTSFVNQIANPEITLETLLADPVERAQAVAAAGCPASAHCPAA